MRRSLGWEGARALEPMAAGSVWVSCSTTSGLWWGSWELAIIFLSVLVHCLSPNYSMVIPINFVRIIIILIQILLTKAWGYKILLYFSVGISLFFFFLIVAQWLILIEAHWTQRNANETLPFRNLHACSISTRCWLAQLPFLRISCAFKWCFYITTLQCHRRHHVSEQIKPPNHICEYYAKNKLCAPSLSVSCVDAL